MGNLNEHQHRLSILLVTYNHEEYIEQAIGSIFGQTLSEDIGPIEVVVADDASTDRTREIIRGFDGKDQRFVFRYLTEQDNLGITRNYQRGFSAITSQYVAVLEGDDYWSDKEKLVKQIKILEENPDCMLCSSNYHIFNQRDEQKSLRIPSSKGWRTISVSDLIADNVIGNFSTCVYRKEALSRIPAETYSIKSYDWIINICVGSVGEIIFLHEPLSVYRIHDKGSWSSMSALPRLQSQLAVIPAYDALTHGRFREDFMILSNRLARDCELAQIHATRRPKGPLSRLWKNIKTKVRGRA